MTQLRAFHAVAAERGFTAAARALRLSQPAITAQVRALEGDHGVELFVRRPRGVELTAVGRSLYSVTEQMFGCADRALQLLTDAAALRSGRLHVGADNPYHLVPLLRAFRRRAPEVELDVELGNAAAITERLDAFSIDVAVMSGEARPGWFSVELARDPILVVVGADHAWADRRSMPLASLHEQAMIRREPGSRTQAELERACAGAGVRPRFDIQIGSREGLREAIAGGLGIGVISSAELGGDARLRGIRVADVSVLLRQHVVCAAARRDAPLIRTFFEGVPPSPRRTRRKPMDG